MTHKQKQSKNWHKKSPVLGILFTHPPQPRQHYLLITFVAPLTLENKTTQHISKDEYPTRQHINSITTQYHTFLHIQTPHQPMPKTHPKIKNPALRDFLLSFHHLFIGYRRGTGHPIWPHSDRQWYILYLQSRFPPDSFLQHGWLPMPPLFPTQHPQ